MSLPTSLSPIRPDRFGRAQAQHLLQRATFGAPPAEVAALTEKGLDTAVASLVGYGSDESELPTADLDPDVKRPPTPEEQRVLAEARRTGDESAREAIRAEVQRRDQMDRRMIDDLRRWWLGVMAETPAPTREKLVLLWHSHFASRYRNVDDAYLMYQQNALFRRHDRDFASLAKGIVHDPAMLRFLNNNQNNKRRPNENLARELMELFTLGEGKYSEDDIKHGARALTGYHVDDNDFVFRERVHDEGPKRILGKTGTLDGDDFVEILLAQKACSEFVALKLYRHFVADVPDRLESVPPEQQLFVRHLGQLIERHAFDLRPVLQTLFKSEHFYSPQIVGRMIKSPAQLVIGTIRTLGTPRRDDESLVQAMRVMGQHLFDPPSVAGWEGGRSWINTSTLFARQNTATYLITGKDPRRGQWNRDRIDYDPQPFFAGVSERTPEAVVDHAVDSLLGPHIVAERRAPLVAFMHQREKGVTNDSLIALLSLVTAMPEYQLC